MVHRASMKIESADAQEARKQHGSDHEDSEMGLAREEIEPISMQDAYATLLHDKKTKRVILDIIYTVAYFALFVGAVFTKIPATDTLFQLGRSVSSTLASSGADTITNDSTMKFFNIQTINDTFVPSVFVTEDYNVNALESDRWGRVASFNKVLDTVIF